MLISSLLGIVLASSTKDSPRRMEPALALVAASPSRSDLLKAMESITDTLKGLKQKETRRRYRMKDPAGKPYPKLTAEDKTQLQTLPKQFEALANQNSQWDKLYEQQNLNRDEFLIWIDNWDCNLSRQGHKLYPSAAIPCVSSKAHHTIQVQMKCSCEKCQDSPHSIWLYDWAERLGRDVGSDQLLLVEVLPASKGWKTFSHMLEPQRIEVNVDWRSFNMSLYPEGANYDLMATTRKYFSVLWHSYNRWSNPNGMNCNSFANRVCDSLDIKPNGNTFTNAVKYTANLMS